MNFATFVKDKNAIKAQSLTPCGSSVFRELCSEYSDKLPCCDVIKPRENRFIDRAKILWGEADCVDLFELKEELLKTEGLKFKTASWCMYPVLKKGDILKITPAKIDEIKIGDIPAYRSHGKLYAHRAIDKQLIDGKQFLVTEPDCCLSFNDDKNREKVSGENILGKIEAIERGRKIFSPEKRKVTLEDKFLYQMSQVSSKSVILLGRFLETVLVKIQSLKFYQALVKRLAVKMRTRLNFELALPFSNEILHRVYNYIPLRVDKGFNFPSLKEVEIFHLVVKFNDTPLGCATILNRPDCCPYKGFWIVDVYIRLKYRGLGFDSILLAKIEDIFKEAGIDNVELFLLDKSNFVESKNANVLSNTEKLLLICARKDLGEELKKKAQDLIKEGIDWERFSEFTMRGGVTILVYNALMTIASRGRISQRALDRLRSAYLFIMSKVNFQYKESIEILRLFAKNDIPVIPLKGTLLSKQLYSDITARGLSVDFDLLIEEKNRARTISLLQELGYSFNPDDEIKQWQWKHVFLKSKAMAVDLRWDITMMGRSKERIEGLWKGTRRVFADEDVSYYEFKEEELLLYLSIHLVHSDSFMQLRYVCDINELLCKYEGLLNWNSIVKMAKRWKVSNSLYAALQLSKNLFGSDIPLEVLQKLKPGFLKLILIKTFAHKKVILRDCLRKRLMNIFLGYIFFELIEARSLSEYIAIAKMVLFPPKEVLLDAKNDGPKPLFIKYPIRLFKGVFKIIRITCFYR